MLHPPVYLRNYERWLYPLKKRFHSSLVIVVLLISCGLSITGIAQTKKLTTFRKPQTSNDPLMSLPTSDGVISVDMQRLLNEMLPRVLADDPAKLAEVNARIDKIKARTGIDVRSFERIALGMRFVDDVAPNSIKVEAVALARGRSNAQAMLTAGLLAEGSKYKYKQQKYGGKTIYIFNSDDLFGKDDVPQVSIGEDAKKAGGKAAEIADGLLQQIMNFKGEVAIAAIDANTLAIGQPASVRAAIDSGAGRGRVDVALAALATRGPNAVVGYGVNVPSNSSRYFGFDNDQISTNIDSIRQVYGFVGSTSTGFEMQNFARTSTAAQAQQVYNMLEGFKDLGGFFASSLSGDKGKLAQNALENLKISKEGNEVVIKLELAQADVAMLVRVFDKRN